MRNNKGFTLIELMVVILIVAILAAVLVPIMRGRLDAAKWSEGKAGAGTIATALRAYCVERNQDLPGTFGTPTKAQLGFTPEDLDGRYFDSTNYTIAGFTYVADSGAFTYSITVSRPLGISSGGPWTLNADGGWSEAGVGTF
jgi:type IV pilus assembly protein PilA